MYVVTDCHQQTLPVCATTTSGKYFTFTLSNVYTASLPSCVSPLINQLFLLGFNTDTLCDTRSEICNVSKNGYLALCGGCNDEWWMMNYMMNDSSSSYKKPLIWRVFALLCHSLTSVGTSRWELTKYFQSIIFLSYFILRPVLWN